MTGQGNIHLASRSTSRSDSRLLGPQHFDHVIVDRFGNLFEPMRNPGRNYDHIALGKFMGLAALDLRADELARPGLSLANHSSTRHEGRVALDNINDVRLF